MAFSHCHLVSLHITPSFYLLSACVRSLMIMLSTIQYLDQRFFFYIKELECTIIMVTYADGNRTVHTSYGHDITFEYKQMNTNLKAGFFLIRRQDSISKIFCLFIPPWRNCTEGSIRVNCCLTARRSEDLKALGSWGPLCVQFSYFSFA